MKSALVLFSGGQDSSTCLAWALQNFEKVETLAFIYGQRNLIELECRNYIREKIIKLIPEWKTRLGEDHVLPLETLGQISDTALTRNIQIKINENGLPNTFVPGRNIIFFTFAAALAYRRNLKNIVAGMCETDVSDYPDCRHDTIESLQKTINLGMDSNFILYTPLIKMNKAATWKMAQEIGGKALVDLILEESHTCYLGERQQRHIWGYGCGSCIACKLREQGWLQYRIQQNQL